MTKKPKKTPALDEVLLIQLEALARGLSIVEMLALDILIEFESYGAPEETTGLRADLIIEQIDTARRIVATMQAKAEKGE